MALKNSPSPLKNLRILAQLMDSQFRIPGTNIRFGLDALIGLVPVVGDFSTFLVSGYMVMILAKNGASGNVLARMILNIFIDALVGSVPLFGDLFDVAFKANQMNLRLMEKHYVEGKYKGGAWKVLIPLLLLTFILVAGLSYLLYKFFSWLF